MILLVLFILIIAIILYLLFRKKSKGKRATFAQFGQFDETQTTTNKCLWESPCGTNGTLIQDCKDSTGNIVPCDPSVNEPVYLKSGKCNCVNGYTGPQCQYSNSVTCNSNGTANNDGTCTCATGYNGASCQYSRTITCNNRGNPNPDGSCSCDYDNPDPMCSYQKIGCGFSKCGLNQMLYIAKDNKTFLCADADECNWTTTDPNLCGVNGILNSSIPNLLSEGVQIMCGVPMMITTCKLFGLTKPRVLYRDPVTNTIRFEVLEDIRKENGNYTWIYLCNQPYPVLALYSDYVNKTNPLPSINWTGVNSDTGFGTGNEAWVTYDYNDRYLCVGSSDQHCKGILGYNPQSFAIGSNPDHGFIFQDVDVWYSILIGADGTLPQGL